MAPEGWKWPQRGWKWSIRDRHARGCTCLLQEHDLRRWQGSGRHLLSLRLSGSQPQLQAGEGPEVLHQGLQERLRAQGRLGAAGGDLRGAEGRHCGLEAAQVPHGLGLQQLLGDARGPQALLQQVPRRARRRRPAALRAARARPLRHPHRPPGQLRARGGLPDLGNGGKQRGD